MGKSDKCRNGVATFALAEPMSARGPWWRHCLHRPASPPEPSRRAGFTGRRTVLSARHVFLALLLPVLSAGPSFAGEAPRSGEPAAGNAHEIPSGGTAISGAEIERRGYATLPDAARWIPGLTVIDQGPRGGAQLESAAPRIARGLDAGVPALWGDIPIAFDPRLQDMERVEVMLGPQGVSHGPGAMAGVVRYVPRKPDTRRRTFEVHGEGFAQAQSGDPGGDFGLTSNVPLADGKLALRASLGVWRDPGFIDYSHVLREPGVSHPEPAAGTAAGHLYRKSDADTGRTLAARLSLLWNATEDVEVLLSHQTQQLEAGGYRINHARAYGTGGYEAARRYTEPMDRSDRLWSLAVGWDLGPARLSSTLGYTESSAQGRRDQTDFLLRNFGIAGLLPSDATLPDFGARPCGSADRSPFCAFSAFTRDEREEEALHGTLRLASTGDGPWGWTAGVSWRELKGESSSREFAPGLSRFAGIDPPVRGDLEYLSEDSYEETQYGVFGTLSRRLGERLRLFAGARRFWIEETSGGATEFPFTPEYNTPHPRTRNSHGGTLFTVGAAYRLGGDRLVYVTRSEGRGASAGGSNSFPICTPEQIAAGEAGGQPSCLHEHQKRIEPDAMTNYEIGLRGTWLDGRVAVNGALFHTEWKDARMSGRTPFSKQVITQNVDARSRGLELALALRPADRLRLRGYWSWAQAELTEDAPGLLPDGADAFKGDRLAGAPKHRSGLIVSQGVRLSDDLQLVLSYDYAWTGSVLTKIGGREGGERLPSYGVHGLSASLWGESSSWTATLYAENLFDKYAVTRTAGVPDDIRAADAFTLRAYSSYVLPPRRVGLRFRCAF